MEGINVPEKEISKHNHPEDVTFHLHKEEMQVSKKWVDTADVKVYKKTYIEAKQITVPVTREELIIEKKIANPKGNTDAQMETIRIPLSEERIEVSLHPTVLEEVDIFKKQFEELKQVNDTVKEEKLHIDTVGDIKVKVDD
jgi:uncharacterized protein (TIGR02271 family)